MKYCRRRESVTSLRWFILVYSSVNKNNPKSLLYFARSCRGQGTYFLFGQKVSKNPTAASAASEVSAVAEPVVTAPADAEKKVNEDLVLRLKKRTWRANVDSAALGPAKHNLVTLGYHKSTVGTMGNKR